MNILFCSVGRRVELLNDFRKSLSAGSTIVATDMSRYAPASFVADRFYLVPPVIDPSYLDIILDICKKENIQAVTTLIDPEIQILAANREAFQAIGVEVLAPYEESAKVCYDKYRLYQYLKECGVRTQKTYGCLADAESAISAGELALPVFVKPRTGSGSVGARKVDTQEELCVAFAENPSLIAQEYMDCQDLDADVYVDTISHQTVSIFGKKKIETRIGGANKTISFKDEKLFDFLQSTLTHFKFNGPIDCDLFYRDGEYYLSEINPRFGGAYLHAYGAGVDFVKLIENNIAGISNEPEFGNYDENIVMMMYDSVIIEKIENEDINSGK